MPDATNAAERLGPMMHGTIVVAGGCAQRPFYAGHTWQFLEYLLGLKDLGWEVLFLDRLDPAMCVDASGRQVPLEESLAWRYFHSAMCRFGLAEDFSILCGPDRPHVGVSRSEVLQRTRHAAFLLNVMGFLTDEEILASAQRRVFLDTDPGMPQMWRELGLADVFAGHDDFVTIGENIGRPGCTIPTCGHSWITMRQPVVLQQWPQADTDPQAALTSVVSWRGPFGPVDYGGKRYGLRVHEFRRFAELPSRVDERFELALDIDPADAADAEHLQANGWKLADPKQVASEPLAYQEFIRRSKAEFMIAKNLYVETQGGWFSDRSTCYLASGKPVIAQDTGLRSIYPVGEGLLTFGNLDEAADAVEEVRRNYSRHAQAARAIAEEYFDSRKVFLRLLAHLGVG